MKLKINKEQILKSIDAVVNKTFQMDMVWDWPCGVAFYGVAEAYEKTGNKKYLDQLTLWIDEYMALGMPPWNVNACAMGHVLITVYEGTKDEKYLKLIDSKVNYLTQDALRFGDGVLQHTVSADNDFPEQAWADTLFMAAFFLLRVGIMRKDQGLIEDALNQYYWHIKYLMDDQDGLWYHGYNHLQLDHMSGFYWGRANAWASYTMSQVIKRLPEWYVYPKCMDVQCAVRDQLSVLKQYQTEEGLWRTIINDEQTYEEVSATCGIAAAMIDNDNPLHLKYVNKALDGIMKNITEDGKVLNVSAGTAVMRDRDGYQSITKDWIQGWGQGLCLAFLTSLLDRIGNETERELS